MPAIPLLTAVAEQAINQILALDEDTVVRLGELKGKRLTVFVSPLTTGITLVFSDQIDVITESESFEQVCAALNEASGQCCIKTTLSTLPELRETGNITRLIRAGKLELEGDIYIAQKVSALFSELDIDWEEHLSAITGDIAAHQIMNAGQTAHKRVQEFFTRTASTMANTLVEEKQLAAHRLAVLHFSDEVDRIKDDVARLEARLRQLEGS